MGSLRNRSFGIIMLLLALVAIAPGISIVAGLLLMIPVLEMIVAKPEPASGQAYHSDCPNDGQEVAQRFDGGTGLLRD
jgi:hypothetical protein